MRGTYVVGWLDVSEWGDGLGATAYGLWATGWRPIGRRPSPFAAVPCNAFSGDSISVIEAGDGAGTVFHGGADGDALRQ